MSKKQLSDICEESLFQELYAQHAQDLHNFLYYKYGADNNPKDLVQEAFIKLWKHCKDVTQDKAKGFLFTVARNQMLNDLDKKKTALKYQQVPVRDRTLETPEYVMEESQYQERLQSALEQLSEEQRVTFLLNRVEGKKHQEIADLLGISRKTVEKRIYTALKKLRQHVKEL